MKDRKAPLERRRPLLFLAGLVFALSVTLVSFEWRTPYTMPTIPTGPTVGEDEPIWIPVTLLPEPKKQLEKPALPEKKPEPTIIDLTNTNKPENNASEKPQFPEIFEPQNGTLVKTSEPSVVDNVGPEKFPTVQAEYCGGEQAMFDFLKQELEYPEIPRINGISGTVYVQFVVGKDGHLRDAQILRPVDPWLDGEALRVAKMLDCFTPGMKNGNKVDVYFVLPIRFALT
ncbi:MAG: TonB family protein [Flavobacteriales bacterium]|nr:TonB family protein [Flavobacteriales bacterium]